MRKQRDSVLRSLKAFGDFGGVSEEDKRDEVYRGVRQGLFQITQLSRVYKGVLPSHVHRDAVGNLLDVLVSYVVKGVLSLEDIVSSDSTELKLVLDMVLEKGPSVMLFGEEEAKELPHHCPSWLQLQELAFVLDARLQEIVDRWDKGKGSLAKQFKAVQIRNMIKALFTNTDRRATALEKIVVV
jgi:centromere/kinetochore protein ZW10